MNRNLLNAPHLTALVALLLLFGCDKADPVPERVAPPPSTAQESPKASVRDFQIEEAATASFLIDAPLEKIKGSSNQARGTFRLDPNDITKLTGEVDVNLAALKTSTFEDEGKNAKQTEHAHNWLELGADVEEKQRKENQWVRFSIKKVTVDGPSDLAKVAEVDGKRTVNAVAEGELWLHGVTSPKKVALKVEVSGPPAAPSALKITTKEPLKLSLKEHDVKPRDLAGKFLQGALDQVGDKIVDEVQVSLELSAK